MESLELHLKHGAFV